MKALVWGISGLFVLAACAGAAELNLRVSCGLPDADRNLVRGAFHGRVAMRFQLDHDDSGQCRADSRRGNYNRAELRSDYLPRDRTVRVAFDIFIPKSFPATGGIFIGQFHQRREKPLILLAATRDFYKVNTGSGLRKLSATITRRAHLFERGDYGRWHRIVMAARFSRREGGFIRVYSDGDIKFEATGRTVETEPYFKIGLYGRKDRMAGPLTIYVTEPELIVE